MNIDVWNEVGNRIQNPNDACQFISALMEECIDQTFNRLITAHFTNPPSQIYDSIIAFHADCSKRFTVKAIYLEMNGFEINPDRWYFDLFGYKSAPPNDDSFDWISEWQSPDSPTVTLTGLESIQELFATYIGNKLYQDKNKAYNEELATLLVMAKFCRLISGSLKNNKLGVPVYATAHDFDLIYHKSA